MTDKPMINNPVYVLLARHRDGSVDKVLAVYDDEDTAKRTLRIINNAGSAMAVEIVETEMVSFL